MAADLAGRVAIVAMGWPPAATVASRLAEAGATVVLVGDAPAEAGEILSGLEAAGSGRGAFFRLENDGEGDDVEALVEFVAEQFSR